MTNSGNEKHVEPDDTSTSDPGKNPVATGLNLTVSLPDIEVEMVNASTLDDYEIWLFISSVLASSLAGFVVAYMQDTSKNYLFWNSVVFGILFAISFITALVKRYDLRQQANKFELQDTKWSIVPDE